MPTLNEAAEVLRLRAALRKAEAHMTNPKGGRGCVCRCSVIDGHTGDCPVIAALDADPGPLVAAVEGMKTTLEFIVTALCVGHGERTTDPTCEICQANARAQAALDAYRAALKGEANRG